MAEVLITLTIIGVIAALTIPNLMRKWEDQHTVSAVKEAYALINNAIKLAISENGEFEDWALPDSSSVNYSTVNTDYFWQRVSPYLKFSCTKADNECGVNKIPRYYYYKRLNGSVLYSFAGSTAMYGQINNGIFVGASIYGTNNYYRSHNMNISKKIGKVFGSMFIDLNGLKGPNRFGYDVFMFQIVLYPSALMPYYYGSFERCSPTDTVQTDTSCSYWIMHHGNMDYKYRDVSAEW